MHIQVENKAVGYTIIVSDHIDVSYYIDQFDYSFVQFSKTLIWGFVLFNNNVGSSLLFVLLSRLSCHELEQLMNYVVVPYCSYDATECFLLYIYRPTILQVF